MSFKSKVKAFEGMMEAGQVSIVQRRLSTKCDNHPDEFLRLYCTKCDVLICDCCIIGDHESHKKAKLADVLPEKKQAFIERMNNCKAMLPSLEDIDNGILNNIRIYTEDANQLKSYIKDRNELLKSELDQTTNKLISQLEQKEKEDKGILEELRKNNQQHIKQLKQITESEGNIQGRNDTEVLRYITEKNRDLDTILSKQNTSVPFLQPPSFCKHDDNFHIQKLVGYFVGNNDETVYERSDSESENEQLNPNEFLKCQVAVDYKLAGKNDKRRQTLVLRDDQFEREVASHLKTISCTAESSFMVETNANKISGASKTVAWFFSTEQTDGNPVNLVQITHRGKVKKQFSLEFTIFDVAATSFGDLLATDGSGCHVIKIRPGIMQKLFGDVVKTLADLSPFTTRGIDVAADDTIFLCASDPNTNKHKVVKLDPNGELKMEFGEETFSSPNRIKLGPFGVIYVLQDSDMIALYPEGGVKFGYYGSPEGKNRTFRPVDIETLWDRYIIVSDGGTTSVHVLNTSGMFLQHLPVADDLQGPLMITMDKTDRLWIYCTDKKVQVTRIS